MTLPAHPTPPEPPPASAALALWLGATWLGGALGPALLRRRLAQGKEDPERWGEKLGRVTRARPPGRLIWVHAVSVGESLSVLPLVKRLLDSDSNLHVLLTCTTVTAAALMQDRLPDRAIQQYLPLDLAGPVTAFLDHWHPDLAVMVESEFWPRLIHQAHKRGIPMVLANARISDRSAARWGRMRGLAQALLRRFTLLTAPDQAAAAKLQALGASPARVAMLGSLKRGADRLPVDPQALGTLRAAFADRPLWLAASTHPGEEGIVAAAHGLIKLALPGACLILAPRHPPRAAAIRAELEAAGLSVAQRSLGEEPGKSDVYLADTLGEMGLWLDLAPIAFIGGSLVAVGGHNAYEPALHGTAILHGPDVSNFADLYQRLDRAGAALTVVDARTLAKAVLDLQDATARARLIAAASAVLAQEGDAVTATAAAILSLLPRQA